LLSNLMLDDLDRELEKRGHRFVRYADDRNISVRSEGAGRRVMASVSRFLTRKLKPKVNQAKSAVARPRQVKFLGSRFVGGKRSLASQTVQRLKERVRALTPRSGRSMRQMVGDLSDCLRGWQGYYGLCQTPSVLRRLDSWIRRRLRRTAWKHWKKPKKRCAELRKRGIPAALATRTAGSSRGPWRIARSPALHQALPDACFSLLGLPRLAPGR